MIFKYFTVFLLVFLLNIGSFFSQKNTPRPYAIIGNPGMSTLFMGYPNTIEIGYNGGMEKVYYTFENLNYSQINDYSYTVNPIEHKEAKVNFFSKTDSTLLDEWVFNVEPFPRPTMYWLKGKSEILIRYDPEVPLTKANFKLNGWILSISDTNRVITGSGNKLSTEAISMLNACPSGSVIRIQGTFSGTGCMGVPIEGVFKL
jgi:hypothetical protein